MVEESKEPPRLQRLKHIESVVRERCANERLYEMDVLEGYENMEFEEKNVTKYLATFPYPYVNGNLHLGKFFISPCLILISSDFSFTGHAYSMSKAEFMTRYQR